MRTGNFINFLNPAAPKGLIASAHEWVASRGGHAMQLRQPRPAAWGREVFAAEENTHLLDYAHVPTAFDEFSSVRWTATPAASLFYLQGCRVLGGEGAVISPDNKVFAEFTLPPQQDWRDHSCFRRRRIPPVTRLKGWYATITWPESQFFFHWMIESLPRMAVLGERAKVLDGLFVAGPLQKFHMESLELLGIDPGKLIPLSVESHFQPEHLFVPTGFAMYNPPRWMHTWYQREYLAAALGRAESSVPARRIYISRGDAPARRVQNEQAVIHALARWDFEVVRLSTMSMAQQARTFHEADVIVAPHGAGLSNLVFCRPGTAIVEVLPPRWMSPCFMTLASSAGCRYRHLLAREIPGQAENRPQAADVDIPVEDLVDTLTALLDKRVSR